MRERPNNKIHYTDEEEVDNNSTTTVKVDADPPESSRFAALFSVVETRGPMHVALFKVIT